MCCIFTCCGWMIDLIQRLWTFTMSCCISSAVCCSLVTASLSGIALGYNYSLAEYIDLKETNVSIYLKRGIFDDEIAEDIDWRRSGHQPVAGHIREDNLMTAPADEPLKPARRLDDSILESDAKNNFEGALMKLTAKPPDFNPKAFTVPPMTLEDIDESPLPYPVDHLKAVQSLINKQKEIENNRRNMKNQNAIDNVDERYEKPQIPVESGRRMMNKLFSNIQSQEDISTSNSLRLAVPDNQIGDKSKWVKPKPPPSGFNRDLFYDYFERRPFSIPTPITPRAGPARPTRPKATPRLPVKSTLTRTTLTRERMVPLAPQGGDIADDFDALKGKLSMDKFDVPGFQDHFGSKMRKGPKQGEDDYEDEIKGIPLRKKRDNNDKVNIIKMEFKSEETKLLTKLIPTLAISTEQYTATYTKPKSGVTETNIAYKNQIYTDKLLKISIYSNI